MPMRPIFDRYELLEAYDESRSFSSYKNYRMKIRCTPGVFGRFRGHKPYVFQVEGRKSLWRYIDACHDKQDFVYRYRRQRTVSYVLDPLFNGLLKRAHNEGMIERR